MSRKTEADPPGHRPPSGPTPPPPTSSNSNIALLGDAWNACQQAMAKIEAVATALGQPVKPTADPPGHRP